MAVKSFSKEKTAGVLKYQIEYTVMPLKRSTFEVYFGMKIFMILGEVILGSTAYIF